jgi:hypothetical protein
MNIIILLFTYIFHSRYEGYDMRNVVIKPTILDVKYQLLILKNNTVTEEDLLLLKCKKNYDTMKIIRQLEDETIGIHQKLQIIDLNTEFTDKITRCDITKGGLYTFWEDE